MPAAIVLDRKNIRHVAFASDAHRCLGSLLARMELRCALEEFHRRIPDYRVTPGKSLTYPGGTVRSVSYLLLQFTAR